MFGGRGRLRVGERVQLETGVRLVLCNPGAVIDIGDRVLISWDTKIVAMQRISIGSGSAISWNVSIMDCDFHVIDETEPTVPVEVGECVLICAHTIVLIGDGAVVGAGSIVVDDVPSRALVAGLPATVRRRNVTWR